MRILQHVTVRVDGYTIGDYSGKGALMAAFAAIETDYGVETLWSMAEYTLIYDDGEVVVLPSQ